MIYFEIIVLRFKNKRNTSTY